MMRACLLVGFLCLFHVIEAQENTDSLRENWENTDLSDSLRLKSINQLAWEGFLFSEPDSAFYYAQLHYEFAKERNLKKEMAVARNTQGTSFYMIGNYAKAMDYFYQSLKIKEQINDTLGIAATLNNIGMINDNQGHRKEAIENYTKAIEFIKRINGYNKNVEIQKTFVASYHNLGSLYLNDNPEKAMEFFNIALSISEKLGFQREQAYAYNSLGHIYSDRNELEKGLEYYNKSLEILEKIGDKGAMVDALNNLGILYYDQGNYTRTISYVNEALDMAQKNGLNNGISDAANILYLCHKALNNYKKALSLLELHMTTRDSLQSEANKKEVIRQGYKYKYEKQAAADSIAFANQQEIKNIKIAEQQTQLNSEQTQRFLLYGVLAMIIILAIVLYQGDKRKIEAAKIIALQKEEVESQRDKIIDQHALLEERNRKITEFNNNLESLVAARTMELEKSLDQIRSYQHDLAHNIRAPFVSLMGLLNMIKDERFDSNENEKILQELQNTSDKIALVLKDISIELNKPEDNINDIEV
ncbi:MAG TPA: tetratricopeptide repeat protein [Fulvivirga sp.]|nr:tetratricopeptide repeat protein [Fulvivirga sp.]